ncbi:MAG: winged helix-turn-helix transcriptional regulator [Verrucomicrobia bacterium]|nr:winged helix-turn-helix transcriptional regulator [Verrucomicrobiota bacterium]
MYILVVEPDIASLGSLFGDPSRARILLALVDGRSLPASDLAKLAGVTPQTASLHLTKLMKGQLLKVIAQGRHRYYRLADGRVASLIESMSILAPVSASPERRHTPIQDARTCYRHLAGKLAVLLNTSLIDRGFLKEKPERVYFVTESGTRFFTGLNINVNTLRQKQTVLARPCLDWSERRNHLAGSLGAALAEKLFDEYWIRRVANSRQVIVTEEGSEQLKSRFGIEWEASIPR